VIKYHPDEEVQALIDSLMQELGLRGRVVGVRSTGSKSRHTIARIWSFPKIWQVALGMLPTYVIEVIERRWKKMSDKEKKEIIVHELTHLPKNFTGGLVNHNKHFRRRLKDRLEKVRDKS
jgi:predicted metallopeptidase